MFRWLCRALPFGRRSEIQGAAYLRSIGFKIVASGYRTRMGELDLIAWDGDVLVFVEVKARHSTDPPEAAVGLRKQQRVARASKAYIGRHGLHNTLYRFDILAITVLPGFDPEFRLLRNAFSVPEFRLRP